MPDIKTLMNLRIQKSDEDYKEWFTAIAKELMHKYKIVAKGVSYSFQQIEFYYYDESHKDTTVYGYSADMDKLKKRIQRHKRKQCETFTWFIHYSGIDIVFGQENNPAGILIRALNRIEENGTVELIDGPLVVMLELLNQSINVFDSIGFELKLVTVENPFEGVIKPGERKGLGVSDYQLAPYKFTLK